MPRQKPILIEKNNNINTGSSYDAILEKAKEVHGNTYAKYEYSHRLKRGVYRGESIFSSQDEYKRNRQDVIRVFFTRNDKKLNNN